jgi:hypothetical protein
MPLSTHFVPAEYLCPLREYERFGKRKDTLKSDAEDFYSQRSLLGKVVKSESSSEKS